MMGFSIKMKFNVMVFEDQRLPAASHGGNSIGLAEYLHNLIL